MSGKYWYTDSNGKRKRTAAGVRHEYQSFQSSTKAKKNRAARNSARRSAIKKGLVHKGDSKDVHHSKGISSNKGLVVMSSRKNRGIREKSRLKGSKRKKRR